MTENQMLKAACQAVEALEAEGFVLMASKEGTSFYIQDPDEPAALDANGHDVRDRFRMRLEADQAFRAAVKTFILAERPYGGPL